IAFKRRRSNENNAVFDLVVYDLAAKKEEKYSHDGMDNSPPIWFHDNKHILIHQNSGSSKLLRVDLDTKEFWPIEPLAHSVLPLGFSSAVLSGDDQKLYMAVAPPRSDSKNRVLSI